MIKIPNVVIDTELEKCQCLYGKEILYSLTIALDWLS